MAPLCMIRLDLAYWTKLLNIFVQTEKYVFFFQIKNVFVKTLKYISRYVRRGEGGESAWESSLYSLKRHQMSSNDHFGVSTKNLNSLQCIVWTQPEGSFREMYKHFGLILISLTDVAAVRFMILIGQAQPEPGCSHKKCLWFMIGQYRKPVVF